MAKSHFNNVKKVRRSDATGLPFYYYHQITGARLPDAYGSAQFAAEWAKQEMAADKPAAKSHKDPGTYWSLCEAFMAPDSDAWQKIGAHTRADYQKCRDWMSKQGADGKQASELTQERCEKLLDKAIAELGFRRGMYVLQFNRRLYNWVQGRTARRRKWGNENPWESMEKPDPPKREGPPRHRIWHPWEVRAVLEAAPMGLRRGYVLGAAGLDSSTAAAVLWDQFADGGFNVTRGKTGNESWVNVPEFLQPHLDPDGPRPSEFVTTSIPGDPFTPQGLQKRSSEFLAAMAKAGHVGSGLTFHGLRHTIGKAVADAGGSLHAIQAALQHSSAQMALYYSKGADRKRALQATDSGVSDWFSLEKPKDPGWKNH